jgi:hypothetical protein
MANTILTPSVIAREALMLLESNMVFGNLVFRGHQAEFAGAKAGDTIQVRGPATFTADEYDGTVLTIQDATESSVPVTLEKHFDVSFKVSDREMTLSIEDFGQQLLSPAMLAIAEAVDGYVASKYAEVHQTVGTAGAPPSTLAEVAAVDQALNEARVPLGGRVTVMNPQAKADLFAIPSFAEADKRGDDGTALREASMGRFMGFDHFMNQNVKTHTAGSLTGTIAVSGAHAAGVKSVTLATDAGEAIDLVAGDVVTFAGDPQSYVVGAAVSVGASSSGAVAIAPALQLALAGGEAVSLALGDHVANLAFHPNAIVLAAVPLALPQGAGRAEFVQSRGLGIRVVWDYDKDAKSDVISLDILAGAKVQDPRLITRVLG